MTSTPSLRQTSSKLAGDAREAFLRRAIGSVLQRPAVLHLLTVQENLSMVMRIVGEPEWEAGPGCADGAGCGPACGSGRCSRGGELSAADQRAALTRALVKAPALLVADQPTAQLDTRGTADVVVLLRAAADSGTAVLLATDDEAVAASADRVLVMEAGALNER